MMAAFHAIRLQKKISMPLVLQVVSTLCSSCSVLPLTDISFVMSSCNDTPRVIAPSWIASRIDFLHRQASQALLWFIYLACSLMCDCWPVSQMTFMHGLHKKTTYAKSFSQSVASYWFYLTLFWTGSGRTLYWTGGKKAPPRLTLPFSVWQQWNLVGM